MFHFHWIFFWLIWEMTLEDTFRYLSVLDLRLSVTSLTYFNIVLIPLFFFEVKWKSENAADGLMLMTEMRLLSHKCFRLRQERSVFVSIRKLRRQTSRRAASTFWRPQIVPDRHSRLHSGDPPWGRSGKFKQFIT